MGEAGDVALDAADETVVAGPFGGRAAPYIAERVTAAVGDGLCGGVDLGGGGVVRVGQYPLEGAVGAADRDVLAEPRVVAGRAGAGGAVVQVDLGVAEVEGGAVGVPGEDAVAVGVVEVALTGAVGCLLGVELPLVVPGEVLRGAVQVAGERVACGIVGVAVRGGAGRRRRGRTGEGVRLGAVRRAGRCAVAVGRGGVGGPGSGRTARPPRRGLSRSSVEPASALSSYATAPAPTAPSTATPTGSRTSVGRAGREPPSPPPSTVQTARGILAVRDHVRQPRRAE